MVSKILILFLLSITILKSVNGEIPLTRYGAQCTTECQKHKLNFNNLYWCGIYGGVCY